MNYKTWEEFIASLSNEELTKQLQAMCAYKPPSAYAEKHQQKIAKVAAELARRQSATTNDVPPLGG